MLKRTAMPRPATIGDVDLAVERILAQSYKTGLDPLPALRQLAVHAAASELRSTVLEQQLKTWMAAAEVQAVTDRNTRIMGFALLAVIYAVYIAIWASFGATVEWSTPVFGSGLFLLPLVFWRATRMLISARR